MTLIINPPLPAIPIYPWMFTQEFYIGVLETVRASQAAINPQYDFEILKNEIEPRFSDSDKMLIVNSLIGDRRDTNQSRTDKDVEIDFIFEIIARAGDEGLNRADGVAVEKAQYLCSMVEYALTALYNNIDPALTPGTMSPGNLEVSLVSPEEIRKSGKEIIIFGTIKLTAKYGLSYADYINLPLLSDIKMLIGGSDYIFPANI